AKLLYASQLTSEKQNVFLLVFLQQEVNSSEPDFRCQIYFDYVIVRLFLKNTNNKRCCDGMEYRNL
ncbi:MAG: hypothetical protein ABF777_06685, partial [Liquorilactobacillus satsumensis]|uniref:hypothetical protein n=1 Tax=Liquorilactobacillus satsumensis TaxID=259059 RepID=UPI0039ED5194